MTKLKRCPCCNSENVGPDFDFPTEEGDSGITIRCGHCGLMLTPSYWPSDDDGDCLSQDSDEVQEVLNELSALWNRRFEMVASRDVHSIHIFLTQLESNKYLPLIVRALSH